MNNPRDYLFQLYNYTSISATVCPRHGLLQTGIRECGHFAPPKNNKYRLSFDRGMEILWFLLYDSCRLFMVQRLLEPTRFHGNGSISMIRSARVIVHDSGKANNKISCNEKERERGTMGDHVITLETIVCKMRKVLFHDVITWTLEIILETRNETLRNLGTTTIAPISPRIARYPFELQILLGYQNTELPQTESSSDVTGSDRTRVAQRKQKGADPHKGKQLFAQFCPGRKYLREREREMSMLIESVDTANYNKSDFIIPSLTYIIFDVHNVSRCTHNYPEFWCARVGSPETHHGSWPSDII